jgi:hypothetical protein
LDGPHNRQDIGCKLIGCSAVRRVRLHRRLSGSPIAELGAGGFLRCKGGLGPGRDQRPLERQPLRHQPRNEMDVAREAIELCNAIPVRR